ncbi:mitochondrial enolase superfamily member 1 [Grus japonensis]|uniref:Mitochondrial enolase superfamily member 1 n=1 Tax=Grus japonensis TaxID=30415 RepID=A0ABC9W764_GRUJA
MSSIKFLECVEDCFIIQMLDVPTRNEALLDLLLTNQENLLCNISVSDNLGCGDHDIVEFGMLLSTLTVSTKTKALDFRRANFSSLRAQLGGILWENSMEHKGASEHWEFFKNTLLEAQNQFMPFEIRKAKAQLELKLARDVKKHKKGVFRYVNNKHRQKDNIGLLLKKRGELVTNNAEKADILNTFFTSVFTSTVGPQALGTKIQVDANMDLPSVKEELVCKLLQELDPYKLMGPDNIHLRVLRELADIVARPLSIIFEKLWRSGDIPEDLKKAHVTPIYKKSLKEDPGNYRPISLTSIPGKVMEQILLGAITSQMKHVIGKSKRGFTKDKLCLTSLIAFYNKVTCLVDVGRPVDIIYLDFSKAFNTVPHSLLLEKLVCYGLTSGLCGGWGTG